MVKDIQKAVEWCNIPQRLQNRWSFGIKVNELFTLLPAEPEHHQTVNNFPSPPWQLNTPYKEQIPTSVRGIAAWAEDVDLKLWCSLTLIASYQVDTPSTLIDPLMEGQQMEVRKLLQN